MVVGVLKVELYMDGNTSLKGKRQVLRSMIERVKSRFSNVSISEVGSLDLWQKAIVGVSFVSNEAPHVNSILDQITGFIEAMGTARIMNREIEIIHL